MKEGGNDAQHGHLDLRRDKPHFDSRVQDTGNLVGVDVSPVPAGDLG